jgi:NAD(P)-dependent dehydrogenase (short-subunit alcohol dehydrogenase family)
MNLVKDDVILLAGITGRVGSAPLTTLVAEGARVVVLSRDRKRAEAAIAEALEPGVRDRAMPLAADLYDPGSASAAVSECVKTFGRLDALINLAGSGFRRKKIVDSTLGDLRETEAEVIETAYNIAHAALRAMLAQPYLPGARSRGRIVTVTATGAEAPNPGMSAFATAKAGVNALMLSIAREHKAEGIVANALLVGGVAFPGADHFRSDAARATAVSVQELANTLTFLASDRSSGINGALLDLTARLTDR